MNKITMEFRANHFGLKENSKNNYATKALSTLFGYL